VEGRVEAAAAEAAAKKSSLTLRRLQKSNALTAAVKECQQTAVT